jgi:hypothetical protein
LVYFGDVDIEFATASPDAVFSLPPILIWIMIGELGPLPFSITGGKEIENGN